MSITTTSCSLKVKSNFKSRPCRNKQTNDEKHKGYLNESFPKDSNIIPCRNQTNEQKNKARNMETQIETGTKNPNQTETTERKENNTENANDKCQADVLNHSSLNSHRDISTPDGIQMARL
jgi:hypothetical protein